MNKFKHELLAPAGNYLKAIIALNYGADAIYIGPKTYSLRARASNFSIEEIRSIVDYAHNLNKKVYVVLNIFCHNQQILNFKNFFSKIIECNIDGVICADPFIVNVINNFTPKTEIHISTQQSITNSKAALFWKRNGASRIVLAREVDYKNLELITKKISKIIEIEYFIHGAVCISYSGRCTMSNNFSYRDANIGGCAQSCRWKYELINSKNKNIFTMSAKDMNLIENFDKLLKLDIASFKIEGRMKSEHYIATIVSMYREAINDFKNNIFNSNKYFKEIKKAENRLTDIACFDGKPNKKRMLYHEDERKQKQAYAFIVDKKIEKNLFLIKSKNFFTINDLFESISYLGKKQIFNIEEIKSENNEDIKIVNTPMKNFIIKTNAELHEFDIVRRIEGNNNE